MLSIRGTSSWCCKRTILWRSWSTPQEPENVLRSRPCWVPFASPGRRLILRVYKIQCLKPRWVSSENMLKFNCAQLIFAANLKHCKFFDGSTKALEKFRSNLAVCVFCSSSGWVKFRAELSNRWNFSWHYKCIGTTWTWKPSWQDGPCGATRSEGNILVSPGWGEESCFWLLSCVWSWSWSSVFNLFSPLTFAREGRVFSKLAGSRDLMAQYLTSRIWKVTIYNSPWPGITFAPFWKTFHSRISWLSGSGLGTGDWGDCDP